jgi:hypothetical protein
MSEQKQHPTQGSSIPSKHAPQRRRTFSRARSRSPVNAALMIIMPLIFVGTMGYFLFEAGVFEDMITQEKSSLKPAIEKSPDVKTAIKTTPGKPANAPVQTAKTPPRPMARPEAVLDSIAGEKIKMVAPKITRFDKKSRTYIVEAQTAERDKNKPDIVLLKKIKSEIRLPLNSQKIFVTANEGVYNKKTEELDLAGQIHVTTTNGYQATLSTAHVWLKAGRISSNQPVIIYMPQGSIAANGVEMLDGGSKLRFLNRARMEINGNGR